MLAEKTSLVRVASLADLQQSGCLAVTAEGHTLALFSYSGTVYAVDNRCPHMGFPLSRGSVRDGILTCHWHHARFDMASGGTFDEWADDVPTFPVEVRGGEVWVDLEPKIDRVAHHRRRLRDGLERDIPLVIAKAVIALIEGTGDPAEPFRAGLDFGVRCRQAGWGQGLTILTCMMNLLPTLAPEDRSRALYQGLSAVAADCDGSAPRFPARPLPGQAADLPTLKSWFREFIEVRDSDGAERCLVSAIQSGADHAQVADMLFAAATDHRYISTGHPVDFTNKAIEALDLAGWNDAEIILGSLVAGYADSSRMEESNAWRYPVDLISLLDYAFEALPTALTKGQKHPGAWGGFEALVEVILGDDPQATIKALLDALRSGCAPADLAGAVSYAAALRIARFHTSNEFGDWDTALHTFTFANAVQQGLRRVVSADLLRGVFDAAMSVYLDRFLNVPAARLPRVEAGGARPDELLADLAALLDRQQQVDPAGELAARYLATGADVELLLAALGHLLLREDRDFHTIQVVEAAFRQYRLLRDTPAGPHVLIAAARYLGAHAPTMRAEGQTFQIASRLSRGERLFEDIET